MITIEKGSTSRRRRPDKHERVFRDVNLRLLQLLGRIAWRTLGPALRLATPPAVSKLAAGGTLSNDDAVVLARIASLCSLTDPGRLLELKEEYAETASGLTVRYQNRELPMPADWAIGDMSGLILYWLIRISRPKTLVEVGVGNGHSTAVMLAAVDRNDGGRVYGADIRPDAGGLLTDEERASWTFVTLSARHPHRDLAHWLNEIPTPDLMFHDAAHDYLGQRREYATAWRHLNAGGVLLSDDVDASHAFTDFAESLDLKPALILDSRKVVGIVTKAMHA